MRPPLPKAHSQARLSAPDGTSQIDALEQHQIRLFKHTKRRRLHRYTRFAMSECYIAPKVGSKSFPFLIPSASVQVAAIHSLCTPQRHSLWRWSPSHPLPWHRLSLAKLQALRLARLVVPQARLSLQPLPTSWSHISSLMRHSRSS